MIISCGEALVDMVPHAVPGGGPMNVAVAAARLGAPAAFIGAVSTDDSGRQIMAYLAENGVDLSAVQTSDRPTARAIVEHTPKLVFRFEGTDTADTMLEAVDLSVFDPAPSVVHGGTLGLFRGKTADTLADLAAAHRGVVSLDPNIRPQIIDDRARWDHYHDRWVSAADIYKASDEDLAWIWPERSIDGCLEYLHNRGVTAVVVTRGSNGLSVITGEGQVDAPAPKVEVVDTVGAGDTTVAAILVALFEGGFTGTESETGSSRLTDVPLAAWQSIAAGATEAAAITCSRAGANPPTRSELTW